MMKRFVNMIAVLFVLILIGGYIFMRQPQFGKNSSGERLERIRNSPNYKDGKFQNLSKNTDLGGESSFNLYGMLKELFFNRNGKRQPPGELPSIKTDLKNLKSDENVVIWLGHSSFFLRIDGKTMLIDPVIGGYASPTSIYNRSYKGSDIYTSEDFPFIDYLFISHDHYDHLDYETIVKLKPKIRKVITGLGVGAHFEHWGYDKSILIEKDWYESADLGEGFEAVFTPSRHRSGRGIKSNQTLWGSFVIKTPSTKLFYSGDSGYGPHFKDIGEKYGPFDISLMECGQYSRYWKQSHMMPGEVVQASIELKARKILPGHWAKFTLSIHDWDEPINMIIKESELRNIALVHPMIGEKVYINMDNINRRWWKDMN